jgi:hypothetical protein
MLFLWPLKQSIRHAARCAHYPCPLFSIALLNFLTLHAEPHLRLSAIGVIADKASSFYDVTL